MVTRMRLAVIVAVALLALAAGTSYAQGSRPSGTPQGSVQNGVYTNPQAGYSLALPAAWLERGFRWYEYWGAPADQRRPGTQFITDWVYTPTSGGTEAPLLSIYVYDKAYWDNLASQPIALPGVPIAQTASSVFVAFLPQSNPYPDGSADAATYESLFMTVDQVKQAFTATGATPSRPPSAVVTVTEQDNGGEVRLKPTDTLRVNLAANTSTGYTWQATANPLLPQQGDPTYTRPADAPPGVGGIQTFIFAPSGAGSTTLEMAYRRPWETTVAPARTFSVRVVVADAPAATATPAVTPTPSPSAGQTVTVTDADNGGNVAMQTADTLVVSLAGNPTTGYTWQVDPASPLLSQLGDPVYTPSSAALGASGTQTFRFQPTGAGATTLQLVYRRPWETGVAPAKTYSVQLTIR